MNLVFSTPIWHTEYSDFENKTEKENVISSAKEYAQENPNTCGRYLINGYQSPDFLHTKEKLRPLFNYVVHYISQIIDQLNLIDLDIFITSSYVSIMNKRESMILQNFNDSTFSGVFFLKVPDESGYFNIINPSLNSNWNLLKNCKEKNPITSEMVKIVPSEGEIVIWPSYVPFSFETNRHGEELIAIYFNILTLPKQKNQNDV